MKRLRPGYRGKKTTVSVKWKYYPKYYVRKINISYLDVNSDDLPMWFNSIVALHGPALKWINIKSLYTYISILQCFFLHFLLVNKLRTSQINNFHGLKPKFSECQRLECTDYNNQNRKVQRTLNLICKYFKIKSINNCVSLYSFKIYTRLSL